MALNKEKIMPVQRVRVKGQVLTKSAKRAMAFMDGPAASDYKRAMLDATHTYEIERKKKVKEKSSES